MTLARAAKRLDGGETIIDQSAPPAATKSQRVRALEIVVAPAAEQQPTGAADDGSRRRISGPLTGERAELPSSLAAEQLRPLDGRLFARRSLASARRAPQQVSGRALERNISVVAAAAAAVVGNNPIEAAKRRRPRASRAARARQTRLSVSSLGISESGEFMRAPPPMSAATSGAHDDKPTSAASLSAPPLEPRQISRKLWL